MKKIQPFENISVNDIINDIDYYINFFIKNGLIGFRGLYASEEEQEKIFRTFGDKLNWTPNNSSGFIERYVENHENIFNKDKEKTILSWHLECIQNENPQIAGAWNMQKFKCSSDSGNTLFVDAAELYKDMPVEWQIFLLNSIIIDTIPYSEKNTKRYAAEKHYASDDIIARIDARSEDTIGESQKLISIYDKEPNEKQLKIFKDIKSWIAKEVFENKERAIIWSWQEGDLLIPDLHKMHHAVMGGFDPSERQFVGFWARRIKDK